MESPHLPARRRLRMIEKEKFSPKLRVWGIPHALWSAAHLHTSCFSCLMFGADECLRKIVCNGLVIRPQTWQLADKAHANTKAQVSPQKSTCRNLQYSHVCISFANFQAFLLCMLHGLQSHTPVHVCPTRPLVEKKRKETHITQGGFHSPPRSAISSGLHSAENKVFVLF